MNSRFSTLLRMDLRRMLTPIGIAIPFFMLFLTGLFVALEVRFSKRIDPSRILGTFVSGFTLPFLNVLLGGGMVAWDVKDHWLRSLLMRPVTRTSYIMSRMLSLFLLSSLSVIAISFITIVAAGIIAEKDVAWEFNRFLPTLLFILCHGYLIVVLMTMLSCWAPGMFNLALLVFWAIGASSIGAIVDSFKWDNALLIVGKDFLFPAGFLEAAAAVSQDGGEVWPPLFWGIASAIGFTGFALWSVNRMNVEAGTE